MNEQPELRSNPVSYDIEDLVALSRMVPKTRTHILRIAAGAIVILLMFTIVAEAWGLTGFIDWPALGATYFVALLIVPISNRRIRARLWLRMARRSP
jgi:hypothetical protein